MKIAQASAPKGGSVRTAHGGLKNRQSTLSANKKAHLAIRSLLFGVDSLNSERAVYLPKRSVHTERWFGAHSARLFENSQIHPAPQRKTALISADFRGGWIRLIAQGCTCANCPSVSTERWFGAHSARRFKKPPIHPLGKQKSTSRDVLFCWWRGVDSNHRSH